MRYLICAQPKSASTSLMYGLGKVGELTFDQSQFMTASKMSILSRGVRKVWNLVAENSNIRLRLADKEELYGRLRSTYPSFGYECLSLAHSDIADLPEDIDLHSVFPFDLHKQHLPPTASNLALLGPIPKVVLIRDIEHSLDSYLRVPTTELNWVLKDRLSKSPIFRQKMAEEFESWQTGWIKAARKSGDIVIDFEDVINNPEDVLHRTLAHFKLTAATEPSGLPRKRVYS